MWLRISRYWVSAWKSPSFHCHVWFWELRQPEDRVAGNYWGRGRQAWRRLWGHLVWLLTLFQQGTNERCETEKDMYCGFEWAWWGCTAKKGRVAESCTQREKCLKKYSCALQVKSRAIKRDWERRCIRYSRSTSCSGRKSPVCGRKCVHSNCLHCAFSGLKLSFFSASISFHLFCTLVDKGWRKVGFPDDKQLNLRSQDQNWWQKQPLQTFRKWLACRRVLFCMIWMLCRQK